MPNINALKNMPLKELHVFFILDTSDSMEENGKIAALNHGMEETINALRTAARDQGDARIKAAVLEFNSGCRWVTSNGPEDLEEDFEYEYLKPGGLTDMGAALEELNTKLSQHEFLKSMTGAYMPVIIFMTDGYATDNYEKALEEIRNNRWFKRAVKIGFALGEDADTTMIANVVGNREAVIQTSDLDKFKKLINFVVVKSSMLASQAAPASVKDLEGADIVAPLLQEDEDIQVDVDDDRYDPEVVDFDFDDDSDW